MATTNVQAFSGDVEVAKSLYVDSDTLFVDSAQNRVSIGSTTEAIGSFSVAGSNGLHTQLYNAGAAADNKRWFFQLADTQYINYIANDANDTASTWMAVSRTGTTVNSITFPSGNIGINTTAPASDCKLDIHGVLVGRSTAETSQLYLMPGGQGGGGNSNEYSPGNPHMGTIQVISEQTSNDEFSSMCVANKDRDNNVTKNASIGFFTTDTSGTGKYVGKIGFWPEDGNSTSGEFRIYTATSAGYSFPQQRVRVRSNGNVDITTAGGILSVTGEVRGRKDTDTTSYFGRAAVGYCGIGDHMAIAHQDVNNSQSYALLQASNGTTYLNAGTSRAIHFRENNANKMVLNNGKLGIAFNAGYYPISINGGLYTKKWNAYNNNSTAGNYTFPDSGMYFVGFMYANGDDSNISEYYTIGVGKGGANAGVTRHKVSGGYLNYSVQNYDTVRFWSGPPGYTLPVNYNNDNFYLVIYAAGYQ